MNSLKGTKTAECLIRAFAGESQARNRYDIFAKQAKQEKNKVIEDLFTETAENEKAHAKIFYDFLISGFGKNQVHEMQVDASYPVVIGTTVENLKFSSEAENHEWTEVYKSFAEVAQSEGFTEVQKAFENIAIAEKAHDARFNDFKNKMEKQELFKDMQNNYWKCIHCGYIQTGTEAPMACPVCKHPQGYFERYTPYDK